MDDIDYLKLGQSEIGYNIYENIKFHWNYSYILRLIIKILKFVDITEKFKHLFLMHKSISEEIRGIDNAL